MKSISILISIVLMIAIIKTRCKIKNKFIGKTVSNFEESEKTRKVLETFDPHKITKYFMNQKSFNITQLKSLGKQFTDDFFPPSFNSIQGKDSNGKIIDPMMNLEKAANLIAKDHVTGKAPEFKRAPDIFGKGNFATFREFVKPSDVMQNEIGDCYFLSALSAISEYPTLIYNLFRRNVTSKTYGYYEVVLFIDGEWQVVILDDWFVVYGGKTPITPKFVQPKNNTLWVMLLEKAWAKVNRGYANIVTGHIEDAYYSLLGSKSFKIKTDKLSRDEIYNNVSSYLQSYHIVSANSNKGKTTEELDDNGIVKGHAYTILDAVSFNFTPTQNVKLLKLRNPWANHEWKGDWSDNSTLWDKKPELKILAKFNDTRDDGIFFIEIKDFVKYFKNIVWCPSNWNKFIKSYTIEKNELFHPIIFNLILEEDLYLRINVITRHRRFNREDKAYPPNTVTQMFIASYDDKGEVKLISSDKFTEEKFTDNITAIWNTFKKGNYVLWIYNSYFSLPNYKSYHYIVNFVSPAEHFKIKKTGLDEEGVISRKILDSFSNGKNQKSFEEKDDETGGIYYLTANNDRNRIAIFKYYLPLNNDKGPNKALNINIDTTKFSNIRSLAPYNCSSIPKKFSIKIKPGSTFIFLGVQVNTDARDETFFNMGIDWGISNKYTLIQTKFDTIEKLEVSSLCLPSDKIEKYIPDYLNIDYNDLLNKLIKSN